MSISRALLDSIHSDDFEKAEALLKANPNLDVHDVGPSGLEHFRVAVTLNRVEIVKLLLNHPAIDLNRRDHNGQTALWGACNGIKTGVLKLLLRDKRVKYLPDHFGMTPLYFPCLLGRMENIKWALYLRGREINGREVKELIKIANKWKHSDIANLLERFTQNRERVIFQLNVDLEPFDNPALLFATLAFLEDGLLRLKSKPVTAADTTQQRFFRMALQLPIEVQMLLCHCVYELNDDYIPNKMALAAFRKLATALPPRPARIPFPTLPFASSSEGSCSVM